jgi:hypothetical protein
MVGLDTDDRLPSRLTKVWPSGFGASVRFLTLTSDFLTAGLPLRSESRHIRQIGRAQRCDATANQPLASRVLGAFAGGLARRLFRAPLRLEISWPASSGICRKNQADTAGVIATSMR